jgi:hypothetical protein
MKKGTTLIINEIKRNDHNNKNMEINPKHHVAAVTVLNLGYTQPFTRPYYFQCREKMDV